MTPGVIEVIDAMFVSITLEEVIKKYTKKV